MFTKGRNPSNVLSTDIYLFTPANLSASAFYLTQGAEEFNFNDGEKVGTLKSFTSKDNAIPIGNWQLKVQDTKTVIERLWLLVRYVLK